MHNRATLKRHATLVDQMATTLDIDLEESTLRGALPIEDLTDMVLRCTGCANPEACESWLARTAKADQPPSYCRNTAELTALRF